jgi:nucleotide-binding universal stress UspA family protein
MSIFPTRILLATDGSRDAELTARTAVGLAYSTSSKLHVVHVGPVTPIPYYPDIPEGTEPAQVEREAEKLLDEQVEHIEAAGGSVTQSHLRMGGADEEIVALGEEMGAGLIIVGSRGRGRLRRALMGSVSDSVVRHAHCPVMVVRGAKDRERTLFSRRVLLATDGSEDAVLATRTAVDVAEKTASELHVIHATPMPLYVDPSTERIRLPEDDVEKEVKEEAQKVLDKQVQQVEAAGGTIAQTHLRIGRPDEQIVSEAGQIGAGLIVMGSRGLGGVRRALMGSVSDSVVRHAHCPVLVVRREE